MADPTKSSTTTTATPDPQRTTNVTPPIVNKIVADGEDHNPVKEPEKSGTGTTSTPK